MKWIIDRFEGEWALVEYDKGKTMKIPKSALDLNCAENDVLIVQKDERETEERMLKIQNMMNNLFGE